MDKIINDSNKYESPECTAIQLESDSGYLDVTSKGFTTWGTDEEEIDFD